MIKMINFKKAISVQPIAKINSSASRINTIKMKNTLLYIAFFTLTVLGSGCKRVLDIEPVDKLSADQLLSSPGGVQALMANLYGRLPIEDFNYSTNRGFNVGVGTDPNNSGRTAAHFTDEAIHSEFNESGTEEFDYWDDGYRLIRDINSLIANIPQLTSIDQDAKDKISAEAHFLRAYTYFALAKRYGGVPIIKVPQQFNGNIEELKVPRSTEQETWDFILEDCDLAISLFSPSDNGQRRGDKWVALALKSRVALYAASVAKFTHMPYVGISGPAVSQKLAGMDALLADSYYEICLDASKKIMDSGRFGLYQPTPSTPAEAVENYRKLFQNPDQFLTGLKEPIFMKSYARGTSLAHNYDVWFSPRQIILDPNLYPSRLNPTVDFIDAFEDYTDNGVGASVPLKTRNDGVESYYGNFNASTNYTHYPRNEAYKIAETKDARLRAMVLFPGELWGATKIIIQGGMVTASGANFRDAQTSEVGKDGQTYYTFGAANASQYSGFNTSLGNYTRSGFLFKKFLQIDNPIELGWGKSTQSWIDFRYAEILLNYAEAAAEMSVVTPEQQLIGKNALNSVRRRAAHTDEIALNQDNVRKERFVELAFENKRFWDLTRWRVFHKLFENRLRKSIIPAIDLRENNPSIIYIRKMVPNSGVQNYNYNHYYRDIPGIGSNDLVQNP